MEIIFFVHFFDGHKKALTRHIQMVNKLGFDAFAFQLDKPGENTFIPMTSDGKFGWKHVYAEQIEKLLNLLPGKKIVFAFSNPGASAIEAIYQRNATDITALICDSGPSGKLGLSGLKLSYKYFQKRKYTRAFLTGSLLWNWSLFFHKDTLEQLSHFPKNFPVLSIRGWKDDLIAPSEIDLLFEPQTHLKWIKLSLPEAGHLDGLKKCPSEYQDGFLNFVHQLTLTPITDQREQ